MNRDKLLFFRNLLFRTFFIGLAFAIFFFVLTWSIWDDWSAFLTSNFNIGEKELGKMFISSFLNLRIFLVFMVLAPAIALHTLIAKKEQQ